MDIDDLHISHNASAMEDNIYGRQYTVICDVTQQAINVYIENILLFLTIHRGKHILN